MNKMRPKRDSHAPGTYWYYNNWDFNALGTIFEAKTGMPISEAFYKRIAKPIGMQDFGVADLYYIGGPISQHRAYRFEINARDLARFGLLYLRLGCWDGRQIVPRSWVEKSSHADEMVQAFGEDAGGYEYPGGLSTTEFTSQVSLCRPERTQRAGRRALPSGHSSSRFGSRSSL